MAMSPVVALLVLKALLIATAPPKILMGPAMVVDPPIVMFAVLPTLPSVKPVIEDDKARLDIGKLSAFAKLVPDG
jgi:hypothetical protein